MMLFPKEIGEVIGFTTGERLDHFIHDIVTTSMKKKNDILMSAPVEQAMKDLRSFMFENVYQNPKAKSEENKAEALMETLYEYFLQNFDLVPREFKELVDKGDPKEVVVCDYVGAMTDRYAINIYESIFIPKTWHY